jgi:hypothetical protein
MKYIYLSIRFVLILFFGVLGMLSQESSQVQWKRREVSDPFRGTKFIQFELEGKFLTPPKNSNSENPIIVARCSPGEDNKGHTQGKYITGYLATGAVLDSALSSTGDPIIRVQFRLDGGKIQTANWTRSTDFSAIFFKRQYAFAGSGYDDFANLIYGHMTYHKEGTNPPVKRVLFDVPEYLGGEVVMQFDMPDPSDIGETCGLIWHK